jgi:hypothetical protein
MNLLVPLDPEVADLLDTDETVRDALLTLGLPAAHIRDEDEVAQRRSVRQEAEEQAKQQQQLVELAGAAGSAAPALLAAQSGGLPQ